MKIYREESLKDFEPWGGAVSTIEILTDEEIETLEEFMNCDGQVEWTETQINDFLWFDTETIADLFGYEDFEEMWAERCSK